MTLPSTRITSSARAGAQWPRARKAASVSNVENEQVQDLCIEASNSTPVSVQSPPSIRNSRRKRLAFNSCSQEGGTGKGSREFRQRGKGPPRRGSGPDGGPPAA